MLSSRTQYERAYQISMAGWNLCLQRLVSSDEPPTQELEALVNWDLVDDKIKNELLKYK